ncbi:MAG: hypothetical protein IMZ53_10540 [Thermoplasmata archaeon]|nr:hypothetical protein [Thermoplasmata archaeon]MBE3141009.1 hypothetical protein [Thermoplasmata archaeon]
MEQIYQRVRLDVPFRLFLLKILESRALTSSDIKRLMKADYPTKHFSRRRLDQILHDMSGKGLISRKSIEHISSDDFCRYTYTTTRFGKEKIRYYTNALGEE